MFICYFFFFRSFYSYPLIKSYWDFQLSKDFFLLIFIFFCKFRAFPTLASLFLLLTLVSLFTFEIIKPISSNSVKSLFSIFIHHSVSHTLSHVFVSVLLFILFFYISVSSFLANHLFFTCFCRFVIVVVVVLNFSWLFFFICILILWCYFIEIWFKLRFSVIRFVSEYRIFMVIWVQIFFYLLFGRFKVLFFSVAVSDHRKICFN